MVSGNRGDFESVGRRGVGGSVRVREGAVEGRLDGYVGDETGAEDEGSSERKCHFSITRNILSEVTSYGRELLWSTEG